MINYNDFNNTKDHSFNVYNAIKYCRQNGEDGIIFDKGEYHFYSEMASESVMCVSNHDIYGFARIAFLLEDMSDFCIDGGGSTFIFHGDTIPVYINNSSNITIKNFTIDYAKYRILDLTVTKASERTFEATDGDGGEYFVSEGILNICSGCEQPDTMHTLMIRSIGDSKEYIPEVDEDFYIKNPSIFVEDIGNRTLRISNASLNVKVGMHLIANGRLRKLCNVVCNKSSDIRIDKITMYSSYAMGVLAQVCRSITIDNLTVKAHDGKLFSLAADATHFVNCTGLVMVTNSSFSEQMDDALNIHGIFTKITDKSDDYIVVRYMHKSAKGIDIYDVGDTIAVLNPRSLVGNQHFTIRKAEIVNLNYTKLYLNEPIDDINIGDVVESITKNCDLIFENNRVFNNRARGMLIGTKGRVDIRNNYFRSSGSAIMFESDGEYWFESGGTNDVRIYGNRFEKCCIGPIHWGSHVIMTVPRKENVDGVYYHKFISIKDNKFYGNTAPILCANNIAELVFKDNETDCEMKYDIERCGKVTF